MKYLKLVLPLSILLFGAFRCEEPMEPEPTVSDRENIVLSVTPNTGKISVGDTLWLLGKASSKVLDFTTGDSILSDYKSKITVFFYRLKKPINEQDYNTSLAANEFNFHEDVGTIKNEDYSWSHTPEAHSHWDNLHRDITSELSDDRATYNIRIALIPQSVGYFALNTFYGFCVDNFNREFYIPFGDIDDYSFFAQGRYDASWAPIDDRIYFFKVVNDE